MRATVLLALLAASSVTAGPIKRTCRKKASRVGVQNPASLSVLSPSPAIPVQSAVVPSAVAQPVLPVSVQHATLPPVQSPPPPAQSQVQPPAQSEELPPPNQPPSQPPQPTSQQQPPPSTPPKKEGDKDDQGNKDEGDKNKDDKDKDKDKEGDKKDQNNQNQDNNNNNNNNNQNNKNQSPAPPSGFGGSLPNNFVAQWEAGSPKDMVGDFGKIPDPEKAPDGTDAIKHVYPQGLLAKGMLNFYTAGPANAFDTTQMKEIMFTYKVMFAEDFDFVEGGKLPGVYGGRSKQDGKKCSGGDQRDTCFSARLMWRAEGKGELYNYFPGGKQAFCDDPKHKTPPLETVCDDNWGYSVDRGAFVFPKGQWVELAQRIRLNDIGQENGEQELFVNGESKILVSGIRIRTQDDVRFQGIMAQSFFGGSKPKFEPPKDETAFFKDFKLAAISQF